MAGCDVKHTVTYKTVDMFPTCVALDEYLHVEKPSQNETRCIGKGCFSAFEQNINHTIILFFDGAIIFILIAWTVGIMS